LKHDVRHIDLMVLDLEGAELEALKGLDFNACRVENVLIEVRELQAVDNFLRTVGFADMPNLAATTTFIGAHEICCLAQLHSVGIRHQLNPLTKATVRNYRPNKTRCTEQSGCELLWTVARC
jgi:Methyltransferase FkbM domain